MRLVNIATIRLQRDNRGLWDLEHVSASDRFPFDTPSIGQNACFSACIHSVSAMCKSLYEAQLLLVMFASMMLQLTDCAVSELLCLLH
jgi:hypothetical protein